MGEFKVHDQEDTKWMHCWMVATKF